MDNLEDLDLDPVEFDELANLFVELKVFSSPSELHGMLCGMLARPEEIDEHGWLAGAATFLEQTSFDSDEAKTLLLEMFTTTREQLTATGFELLLILPDDDEGISDRAEHLGRWCLGFITGIGAARTALTEEGKETLEDVEKIAQIDEQSLEECEEHEQDLMQLIEYVRMAALMLHSELHSQVDQPAADSSQPSIH
ncbi:MAG: UPF0149 family protein [Pseudomonadales bacterium]